MKIFISYCNNDGLAFASDASDVLEGYGNKAWYFDRDKTTGILRTVDITNHIRYWCDKVLYLCTHGSVSSNGQWKEIGQWDNTSKQIIVIPIDGAAVPDVIDTYIYTGINGGNFKSEFDEFVRNKWADIVKEYDEWTQKIKIRNQ